MSPDGDVFFTGIATGNGSGLTALNATQLTSGTVPTARLGSGTASSSTFLRGDSTFQTVDTNLVADTSPQLGGDLQSNGNDIDFADNDKAIFGADTDLEIHHESSSDSNLINSHKELKIYSNGNTSLNTNNADVMVKGIKNGSVELYYDNELQCLTRHNGLEIKTAGDTDSELTVSGPENRAAVLNMQADDGDDNGDIFRFVVSTSSDFYLQNYAGGSYETNFKALGNGAVELYHNNTKAFSTTQYGVQVESFGTDSSRIQFATAGHTYSQIGYFGLNRFGIDTHDGLEVRDSSDSYATRMMIDSAGKIFFGGDSTNQDANKFVFVGTKATSGGIIQGQLAVADNNAYNTSDNGGGIGFQAKYNSSGNYTQMAAIEGTKANNTDGHYAGLLNFKVRANGGNLNQVMYLTTDSAMYLAGALYVGNELNMQNFAGTPTSKYMDIGFLNNSFYIRRTNGGDGGHSVVMTISSGGVISGNFNDTSDAKLKKNVETISDGAIEDIKKLRPVTFDWIDDTRNDNISGFIAQEVKEVLPNLVDGTEYDPTLNDEEQGIKGGIKSEGYAINSVGVTAHLTKAVQELIAEVETLKAEVAALKG